MELKDQKMMSSSQDDNKEEVVVDEEEGRLPGFRFHPTDEELVTFYLKRKVEKRPISIEIIKQIDIYKHDPWELSKASSVGDKEWYFYCRRERKYRNSIRPNRVTGSGFWKATGIDKPIYSNGGQGNRCVGLKKSLVYYRGSAGKGTKTDWMMHEFRLPTEQQQQQQQQQYAGSNPRDTLQEAEVWTLCRIFKRNRKYTPDWRELSTKRTAAVTSSATISSKACSDESIKNRECYISFANATNQQQQQQQQQQPKYETTNYRNMHTDLKSTEIARYLKEEPDTKKTIYQNSTCNDIAGLSMAHTSASDASNLSSPLNPSSSVDDQAWQLDLLPAYGGNWDDLTSVVQFAIRAPL